MSPWYPESVRAADGSSKEQGRVGESVTFCSTPGILNWGNAPLPGDTSKIWRHFWLTQEGEPLWAETKDAVGLYILQRTGQAPYS